MSFYLNRRNKDWLIDWLFEFDTSNTALQHCCYIVSNGWNVVSTFESCAALKSSLRIVTWHHLNGFIFWIINQSLIEFLGVRLTMRRGVSFSFPLRAFRASVLPLSFQRPASQTTRTLPSLTVNLNFRHFDSWQAEYYYGYAMLMSPNKGETAVHDCHCPGDMAVRMREVLARPWVGVYSVCAPCFKFVL